MEKEDLSDWRLVVEDDLDITPLLRMRHRTATIESMKSLRDPI